MQKNAERGTNIKVRLVISGFACAPDEITRILGLHPTSIWLRGDPIPKTAIVRKQNAWRLDSPAMPDRSLEEQTDALLQAVIPHAKRFKNLPSGSEVELSCVIYAYDHRPIIAFSANAVGDIATIGACIDVDCYDLIEDSRIG